MAPVERPNIDDQKINTCGRCYREGQQYKSANENAYVFRIDVDGELGLNP
jgi:hypothetical protein